MSGLGRGNWVVSGQMLLTGNLIERMTVVRSATRVPSALLRSLLTHPPVYLDSGFIEVFELPRRYMTPSLKFARLQTTSDQKCQNLKEKGFSGATLGHSKKE